MKVAYIMRQPTSKRFSLERMFASVSSACPAGVDWTVHYCPRAPAQPCDVWANLMSVRRLKADIYHIMGDVQYVALALPGERTLLTVADCSLLRREKGIRKAIFKALWYDWPLRRCRLASTISDFTAQDVASVAPHAAEKLRTVYVPVPEGFHFQDRPFNKERPVVLQVGTIWNKNLERVVEALKGLPCRLRIVGYPNPAQQEALVRNGIEVEVLTYIPDEQMPRVYAESDLVVFASLYEGFGIPIIEAQVTGRPVIAGNVCSMPEVAGEGACLVDPTDTEAIRQAILHVMQDGDYRERLVARGLENVRRFTPDRIAAQYVALYREILERVNRRV